MSELEPPQTATATAALAAQGFSAPALAQQGLKMGAPSPFSFEELKKRAQDMARSPYVAPPSPSPEVLYQIDYDAHGKIRFKTDLALWANGPSEFPVTFFHMGRFFQKPVRMHAVEGGQAREIVYESDYFDMPADSPARKLPDNSGFAGFRFQEARTGKLDWKKNDWVAFLGASYFRAIGELYQYGLSARGLAVDVAVFGKNEEFPDFTHVYFETPQAGSNTVTVYALLDGPSVAGAYRFVMQRASAIIMDIDSALYMRQDVSRLGLAPLTSMYWYSEKAKTTAIDWRPEIHDSDGLAMWTGTGERIWRPLNNPPRIITSAFADENPKGFGLLHPVGRDPDRRRDPRQYRGHVGAGGAGPGRSGARAALPYALVGRGALSDTARPGRRHPVRQWWAGRHQPPEGHPQVHGGVHRPAPDPAAERRDPQTRALRLPWRVLEHPHRGGAQQRAGSLAHPVRPDRDGNRAGGDALLPAQRERGPERNLALPISPCVLRLTLQNHTVAGGV